MKYIHLFDTQENRDDYVNSTAFTEPFLSTHDDNNVIVISYNTDTELIKKLNGHDYVDLGLPSGTLWATCNVGASVPEGYGGYYAWGETQTKSDYSSSTYKYGNDTSNLTKYNDTDNKIVLDPEDDVCHVVMGGAWMMPTSAQCQELIDNTTITVTSLNNVDGFLLTSKNNSKTLFIPDAGYKYSSTTDSGTYMWSSNLYSSEIINAWCSYNVGGLYNSRRYNGFTVRGVIK